MKKVRTSSAAQIGRGFVLLRSVSMGISQYQLAKDISVPPRRINEIVHGKRAITADTALRLGRFFRMSPLFWLNLQTRFDLEKTEDQLADRLDKEIRVLSADRV